jgi:hypothetical protein
VQKLLALSLFRLCLVSDVLSNCCTHDLVVQLSCFIFKIVVQHYMYNAYKDINVYAHQHNYKMQLDICLISVTFVLSFDLCILYIISDATLKT